MDDLSNFLADEETREAPRLGMPRVRRECSIRHFVAEPQEKTQGRLPDTQTMEDFTDETQLAPQE